MTLLRIAGALMLGIGLHAADLRIDHVTVAGERLAALEQQAAAVGLQVQYGGVHQNGATEMAIASFPDGSYIEFIAKAPHADPAAFAAHHWARFIDGNAGPCAWAVRPKDFAAQTDWFKSKGVPVEVKDGGRKRPDGEELRWQTASVGTEGSGEFLPFLIRDLTPRERRAYPSGKAANRDETGVLRVVIGVRKLDAAFERFRAVYPDVAKPLRQLDKRFEAELAWIPDTPVVFAAPVGQSWITERLEKFGEGPVAFVLQGKKLKAKDVAESSRWFGRDVAWFDSAKLGGWRLGVEEIH